MRQEPGSENTQIPCTHEQVPNKVALGVRLNRTLHDAGSESALEHGSFIPGELVPLGIVVRCPYREDTDKGALYERYHMYIPVDPGPLIKAAIDGWQDERREDWRDQKVNDVVCESRCDHLVDV